MSGIEDILKKHSNSCIVARCSYCRHEDVYENPYRTPLLNYGEPPKIRCTQCGKNIEIYDFTCKQEEDVTQLGAKRHKSIVIELNKDL